MSSRKSIDPLVWGKGFWESLHYASVDYAVADKAGFEAFYASLRYTLPCENCREHYTQFWNAHPIAPYLEHDDKLREWTLLLHNTVNKRLGKPTWSLEQFNTRYDVREDDDEDAEDKTEQSHQLSLFVTTPAPAPPVPAAAAPAPAMLRPRIQTQGPAFVHVGNGKRVSRAAAPAPASTGKKKCKNCGKKGGPWGS
jgi:hypothetical protein